LISEALDRAYRAARYRRMEKELASANQHLNQRLQELNTIYTVGKSVGSSLDLDDVLDRIVESALNLTSAEEGFILLQEGEKLFLRASKNVEENLARRLYIEATDGVARRVMLSGQPAMLRRDTKIATGYLVRSLLYVPLLVPGRGCIGILGVVNRVHDAGFNENQLFTLSAIADFAAIAVENARLFSAVQAEKTRLRSILEHADDAIMVTDGENRLLLWSKTAGEVFQIPADAQEKPISAYVAHNGLLDLFRRAGGGGEQVHRAEIPLEDDRVFNAQLTAIDDLGCLVVMQDITYLKELDRLKSEFVSTVSHDLRTPLTTIQGYVELLERVGPLNETQRGFIAKALDSLDHITGLISDLLDIGRIEAGYDLEMQPCCLDDLIRQTTETFIPIVEQQGLQLTWMLPKQPLRVLGNMRRLRQVMENLIGNAIKYNHVGGQVEIRAHGDGVHVIVQVHDTGIGIPLSEQPKLFKRFYRVQSPETEVIRGTGLGLAIVKSVVEKHKGRVWVESMPGKGSTFSFILPALREQEELAHQEA
jgi:two-component system NtrC family sensor kinase